MLFKKEHIEKILREEKTMTRRLSKRLYKIGKVYRIQHDWYTWTDIKIKIIRRYKQQLGEISQEEIRKEGYQSLEEFKRAWIEINGSWNPDTEVWVYEFRLVT